MEASGTYLMIREERMLKRTHEDVRIVGEERFGPPDGSVKAPLNTVTDLDRLRRMVRCAATAAGWQEVPDTP